MSATFDRRAFIKLLGISTAIYVLPKNLFVSGTSKLNLTGTMLYAGTYTSEQNNGIYLLNMHPVTGKLRIINSFGGIFNPSFLSIDHKKNFLYAVSEIDNYDGMKSGAVFAYKINSNDYSLEYINKQPSKGAHPCHITVDKKDRFVFVANYTGGNFSVYPILANGRLGEPINVINHNGSGPNKNRQETPHVHSVNIDPQNHCLLVSDLGTDKIMIYNFNDLDGKLTPGKQPWAETKPGSGPRHLVFDNK